MTKLGKKKIVTKLNNGCLGTCLERGSEKAMKVSAALEIASLVFAVMIAQECRYHHVGLANRRRFVDGSIGRVKKTGNCANLQASYLLYV